MDTWHNVKVSRIAVRGRASLLLAVTLSLNLLFKYRHQHALVGQALGMVPAMVVTKWGQPLMRLCRKLYKAVGFSLSKVLMNSILIKYRYNILINL